MILAVDVQYEDNSALAAGVIFPMWSSTEPNRYITKSISGIEPYEPGAFYKRELPCILSLLEDVNEHLEIIVVDGFVTLGKEETKGLGMYLFEALNEKTTVIGVAKKAFKDTPKACEVYRGESLNPLYVTSVGLSLEKAISGVASMHGKHRIPTLLKKADQLCRGING